MTTDREKAETALAAWRAWSARYSPKRRTWRVGDRFQLHGIPSEPMVFEITDLTPKTITFWAPDHDRPTDRLGKYARHYPRAAFVREVAARRIVRVELP